jgi:hypothetical protein
LTTLARPFFKWFHDYVTREIFNALKNKDKQEGENIPTAKKVCVHIKKGFATSFGSLKYIFF